MPPSSPLQEAQEQAHKWLQAPLDPDTRSAIKQLLSPEQAPSLIEAFSVPLCFGTGGLRAKMGIGRSRMNRYSVSLVSQGLAHYLLAQPTDSPPKSLSPTTPDSTATPSPALVAKSSLPTT